MEDMQVNEVIPDNTAAEGRGRSYSPAEVENYILEYMHSNLKAEEFAASKGISRSTFYWWLKAYLKEQGCRSYKDHAIPVQDTISSKIEDRKKQRKKNDQRKLRTTVEKEDYVKRYLKSGQSLSAFALENDIPYGSLREWVGRYNREGYEGLKSRKLRNAGTYEHTSISEREMKDMIKRLRIRILELEIRVIKLKEQKNRNMERGWEQNE